MYYIDWMNRIYGDKMKHIRFRDLERCPYLPGDAGYEEWNYKNDARLKQISESREDLKSTACSYMSHEDRNVRNMAIFIFGFLEE